MALVYTLRGSTSRHYIGCTDEFERRYAEHCAGKCHTTKRIGLPLEIIVTCEVSDMVQAYSLERELKRMKNPSRAIQHLKSVR